MNIPQNEEMTQEYHNNCRKCHELFWTPDGFTDTCPNCLGRRTYDHSKCPAMPRKSWQEEYKEEYEAKLWDGASLAERGETCDLWRSFNKVFSGDSEGHTLVTVEGQIDPLPDYIKNLPIVTDEELNERMYGVGQISRDDYEVQ